jgi:hypothetical protein
VLSWTETKLKISIRRNAGILRSRALAHTAPPAIIK